MYKFGDWVVYDPGYAQQIGRVTKCVGKSAFVCYSTGCTAALTPPKYLRPATEDEIAQADKAIGYNRFNALCPSWDEYACGMCRARKGERMSLLSEQVKGLRERALILRQGDWSDGREDALMMEEAADTIESLRDRLQADATGGTCKVNGTTLWDWEWADYVAYYEHELSCGHTAITMEQEPPNYCDECGAKVVRA